MQTYTNNSFGELEKQRRTRVKKMMVYNHVVCIVF